MCQFYEIGLREQVWKRGLQDHVEFCGYVTQPYIPHFYKDAFLHINVSRTGSMDKTIMEGLSCGCPVLTSNEALFDLLQDYPEFIIHDDEPKKIAQQVKQVYLNQANYEQETLRGLVVGTHDIHSYIEKIRENLYDILHLK